jgi:hypothetical protein
MTTVKPSSGKISIQSDKIAQAFSNSRRLLDRFLPNADIRSAAKLSTSMTSRVVPAMNHNLMPNRVVKQVNALLKQPMMDDTLTKFEVR